MDRKEILTELKKVLAPYTESKEMLAGINEETDLIKDSKIKLGQSGRYYYRCRSTIQH